MEPITVAQIWRYPVKSLQGETVPVAEIDDLGVPGDRQWGIVDLDTGLTLTARRSPELLHAWGRLVDPDTVEVTLPDGSVATDDETVPEAEIDELGVPGDRQWGIVDLGTGLTLTARRAPELLHAWGRLVDPDTVEVTLPDGTVASDDDTLSAWLDRPVALRRARPDSTGTYEIATTIEDEPHAEWVEWSGPEGTFHDSTRTRVSMVGLATIGDWDRRRFRANLVLDVSEAGEEDGLVGRSVAVGGAVLEVTKRIDRCVITTRSQPDGIERDLDVLRTINAARESFLGIGSLVATPGRVAVGDRLTVVDGSDVRSA